MAGTKNKIEISNHSYYYSLEIEGINCFKDKQVLDLSDEKGNFSPWTIILGDNGTGKTTLLKILDRVQPDETAIDFSKQNIKLDVNYYFPKYNFNGIDSELISKKTEQLSKGILTVLRKNNKEDITFGSFQEGKNLFFSEDQIDMFVLSYGASRKMSKSQNLRTSIRSYTNSLFDDSIELINAEEWFLQKEWAFLKSENNTKLKFKREFDLVIELLIDILPDVHKIVSKTIDENNSKPKIEVKTSFGWVNIRDLSYGYQTITALLVDIAFNMMERYSESENPLSEPVIILIDEIDLHLHPKWQRIVIDKLSHHFPKAQFIVTAHSPLILQVAQDKNANIVVCRKEDDRVVIDNNPESVKGWRIDQILTSDLFEVSSSQSTEIERIRTEKINILLKNEISDKDKERLVFINERLNSSPVFSNKESIDAEELIKKAAQILKK